MDRILAELTALSNSLEKIDYNQVYDMVASLRCKYIPSALLHKGHYIDRVRINNSAAEKDLFRNEHEVSYIHDQQILEKDVGLGRSNAAKQAVFYGAIESPEIKQPRVVAYFETSDLFRKPNQLPDNVTEIFTMSRWRIQQTVEVMEMIFGEKALKESQYAKMSFKHQMELLKTKGIPELEEHFLQQGRLFSNEFARNDVQKDEDYKYKIAAAYANYVWDRTDLKGVTYPSVQSIYKGQNVALLPEVVDQFLKLESVAVFKSERINRVSRPIDSILLADLGKDNMDFTYQDYKGIKHLA